MNRRRFVLAVMALHVSNSFGVASVGTKDDLVGTWRILSYEDQASDGARTYPYGKQPIGVLTYTAGGNMSVQITKSPAKATVKRAKMERSGGEKPEPAYTAYFGTYTVDWERKIITHTVEGNLFPVFVGTKHDRPFELEGNRLVLKPRWEQEGKMFLGIRVFERLS